MAADIRCNVIRDPSPEEFERCLEVLAQGFRDYRFFHKIQQRDSDPTALDNLYAHLRTRLIPAAKGDAQLWIAQRGPEGSILGVSVVTYPGRAMHDLPSHQELLPALKARYTPEHRAWLAGPYKAICDAFLLQPPLEKPQAEDYEIVLIATHPDAQRQGIGSALLGAIASHAFGEGRGVWLLTQSRERAKTYAKAGYTELYSSDITFADGEKVPNIAMGRQPPST